MAQTVRDFLLAEVDRKLGDAKHITEDVEKTNRQMSDDERIAVERLLSDVTKLKGQIEEIDSRDELNRKIDEMRGAQTQPAETVEDAKTIGEAFVRSQNYKNLMEAGLSGKWTTGGVEFKNFFAKATVSEGASPIVRDERIPGVTLILSQRLTVADLMASGTTTSNALSVVTETTATNAAAATSEGAAKPESTLILSTGSEPVRKIATFLPVTDEFLEDVDAVRAYIDGRLRLFVQQEEEDQLLNGNGTAPNISGILDRTIQTGTAASLDADSAVDAVYQAITAIRTTAFLEPDGIVVNPTDWASIRLLKDGNEQYYGGGPFTGAYGTGGGMAGDSLWGLNAVVTSAIAQGTVLVGAFRTAATVFRRSGLTVEASNSHDDYFQRNMTAIRAEERLALWVQRPQAFYAITSVDDLLS